MSDDEYVFNHETIVQSAKLEIGVAEGINQWQKNKVQIATSAYRFILVPLGDFFLELPLQYCHSHLP